MQKSNKAVLGNWRMLFSLLVLSFYSACSQDNTVRQPSSPPPRDSVLRAYHWLAAQQDMKTGLVRSYDKPGNQMAWTYDQALWTIAMIERGDITAAQRCADEMLRIRSKKHMAWADAYDSSTGAITAGPIAVGPNAWMGLALLKLHKQTDPDKYLRAALKVGDFILRFQSPEGAAEGSVAGGLDAEGPHFNWTSTEHNVDAIAFLAMLSKVSGQQRYRRSAVKIAKWLDREMWDSVSHCYHPGYSDNATPTISDYAERLDSQSWSLLAQLAAANLDGWPDEISKLLHNGLPWIDQFSCETVENKMPLHGFPKITHGDRATKSIWTEGTAGYILAARRIGHTNEKEPDIVSSLRRLQRQDGAVPYSLGISFPDITKLSNASDLVVARFESHPNSLHGQLGVYGDGEPNWQAIKAAKFTGPYSWYYERGKPGYRTNNVYSGDQSFRLVNAGELCASKTKRWATLGLDLGPLVGSSVKPCDVSDFPYLRFYAKTDHADGAAISVLFRDASSRDYMPQATVTPVPSTLSDQWQAHRVVLKDIATQVDLQQLVHIGFGFGADVGNARETVIYLDDVAFIAAESDNVDRGGDAMPPLFPQNWNYGSIAGTAWFIFMELDINPFSQ